MQRCTIGEKIPDDWSGQMKQTICPFRRGRRELQLSRRSRLQNMSGKIRKSKVKIVVGAPRSKLSVQNQRRGTAKGFRSAARKGTRRATWTKKQRSAVRECAD